MKFSVVPDTIRSQVDPGRGRGVRSEWIQALLEGKTIKINKEDRNRIGGNTQTLRNHGFRLRTGMINDHEVVAWAEKIETEGDPGE